MRPPFAQEDPATARPVTLVAVFARQALPHTSLALGRAAADLARCARACALVCVFECL